MSGKIPAVQGLRGVAALLVLLAHADSLARPPEIVGNFIPSPSAAIGVDVFFVISGFVIAMASQKTGLTWSSFIRNRAMRVLPLYFVCSILALMFYDGLFGGYWNTFLFLPLFDNFAYSNPSHPFGWTIGAEVWFYVLFSFSIALCGRKASIFAASLIAVLVFSTAFYGGNWIFPRFVGSPILFEFAMGIMAFHCSRKINRSVAIAFLVAGPAMMLAGMQALPRLGMHGVIFGDVFFAWVRLIIWGVPSAITFIGVVAFFGNIEIWRPVFWLGEISYSFYMVQPFSHFIMKHYFGFSWIIEWPMFFCLNLFLAYVAHRYIEKPCMNAAKPKQSRSEQSPPLAQES